MSRTLFRGLGIQQWTKTENPDLHDVYIFFCESEGQYTNKQVSYIISHSDTKGARKCVLRWGVILFKIE